MSEPFTRLREEPTAVAVFVVLGLGFLAMFAGANWFWMVWVLGFAVVVPLVALAFEEGDGLDEWTRGRTVTESEDTGEEETLEDPLATLRERYARGELTDEQFERRLERLLETETLEDAERRRHERE